MSKSHDIGTKVKLTMILQEYDNISSGAEGIIENIIDLNCGDELMYYEVKFGNICLDLSENDFEILEKE